MAERRITYDNELEIMIEDYLANPLEAELDRAGPKYSRYWKAVRNSKSPALRYCIILWKYGGPSVLPCTKS